MKTPLLLLALVLGCAQAFAQESSADVYAQAVSAIKRNDCATATALLTHYKEMEKARLDAHPEFLRSIDEQIALCGSHPMVSGKTSPGYQGIMAPSPDGEIKTLPSDPRLKTFR